MTRLPEPHHVSRLFDTLRWYFAPPTPKAKTTRLDDLERRLLVALDRDSTGYPTIDGFPSSTMGAIGGADLTSVESAVERLTHFDNPMAQPERDEIHEHLENACAALDQAIATLAIVGHRLKIIDTLSQPLKATDTAGTGYCQACNDWCPGTHNNRLKSGYCNACCVAWSRAGKPDRAAFELSRRRAM